MLTWSHLRDAKPQECGVVVLGMQNDFCLEEGVFGRSGHELSYVQAAMEQIRQLVEAARRVGCMTVFVQSEYGSNDESPVWASLRRAQIHPPHVVPGTWGHEFCIVPTGDNVVVRGTRYSAFGRTDLQRMLQERGVGHVVVVGVQTHVSVLATVVDACNRDYYVYVPDQAVASYSSEASEWALRIVGSSFGRVVSVESLLAVWSPNDAASNLPMP